MILTIVTKKEFANGIIYALKTEDGFPIEVTDTFLPTYTKDSIGGNNSLRDENLGSRKERWMIGVSVMSGCPVHCKFCATGKLKKWRNLTTKEIVEQIRFICSLNSDLNPNESAEFKINYTRMGEPFLNINNVKKAIEIVEREICETTHHYVSTIGIRDSDFSFVKDNITLQLSLHSLDNNRRNILIPYRNKMSIKELGEVRTSSDLKTTLNLTLVDIKDFDIKGLKKNFPRENFFIKISPINPNKVSDDNQLGKGIIKGENLL